MSTVHPDLAALLRGELSNTAALEAAAHARTCTDCHGELLEVSLGHGLLAGARHAMAPARAAVGEEAGRGRAEDTVLPTRLRRELRRTRWRRPVAIAAAVVLVGGGVGVAALTADRDKGPVRGRPEVTAQTTTSLEPVDPAVGTRPAAMGGRVSMTTDKQLVTRMRVDTRELPRAARGEFYYVWLLDPKTNKMLPLGQVTPGRPARFDIPESLVDAYSAIDISLEADDGHPGHSVTSVLRASYVAPS